MSNVYLCCICKYCSPVSSPTNACSQVHVREWLGCEVGHQEVSRCCTGGESRGTCNLYASMQVRIRLPTLALKPRGDVTKSPKHGYQWPDKKEKGKFFFKKLLTFNKIRQVTNHFSCSILLTHSVFLATKFLKKYVFLWRRVSVQWWI